MTEMTTTDLRVKYILQEGYAAAHGLDADPHPNCPTCGCEIRPTDVLPCEDDGCRAPEVQQ